MNLDRFLRQFAAVILVFLAPLALAEGTRTWEQSKFDDLVKGTAKGVAIRSAGGLELAPAFKALYTTPSTYIWAIASDDSGNVYAAAGAPARIYRITPAGQSTVIFEPQELQVQALVVGGDGTIYAATSPDGKIYKLEYKGGSAAAGSKAGLQKDSSWSSSVLFDPDTKYIWDLIFDKAGNLFVATGDRGEIYRVTQKGEHSLFFKSDEAHIRVLAIDPQGNLIAGSDGSGLIYRISPSGEGFVLYSAPKKEITALAIDRAGIIYAAAVGERRPSAPPLPSAPPSSQSISSQSLPPGMSIGQVATQSSVLSSFPAPGSSSSGGSDIYRVAPDGSPTRLWTSREDIVYALDFNQQGHLLAGTGNRGHIFAITGEDEYADLVKASATQITAFAKAPGGGLYASSSNLGKIFLLGPGPEAEGTYESDIFDAHIFSRWGRAELRGAGNMDLFARSGNVDNPDRNWSVWKNIDLAKDSEVLVPPARFIQWKAVLHAGPPAARVDSVMLNYLPKNIPPDFDEVSVQVGVRYQPLPRIPGSDSGSMSSITPPQIHDRDSLSVKWTVHDDNDDQMVYSVYYRGEGDSRWLLLKENLSDKFYSFDASLLPDGGYKVKVIASDAPSHSPDQALTSEKESARFEVDTTPPQIQGLTAVVEANQIHVTFRAVDSFSTIKRAEYSVDAGEWQFIEPVGQLSDSKVETYDFRASIAERSQATKSARSVAEEQSEHVIVVRAYDRYDNMNTAKFVLRKK